MGSAAAVPDNITVGTHLGAPTQRLPPELLIQTFRQVNLWDRVRISHVSHYWRAITLANEGLWNEIDLTPWCRSPAVPYRRLGTVRDQMLLEFLYRSRSLPFTLIWPGTRGSPIPGRAVTVIIQNMHRMHSLELFLDVSGIQRLFAVRAPRLVSFTCTLYDAWLDLPVRWDAPMLELLELGRTSMRFGMQPLPSLRSFTCEALLDLGRTGTKLFSIFPSLSSLKIGLILSDTIAALSDPPESLTHIDLRTKCGPTADYSPLMVACAGHNVRTLFLESAESCASVLELFTSVVVGVWCMKLDDVFAREIELTAKEDDISYTIGCARTVCMSLAPQITAHLTRLASLTANARLVVEMDALGGWSRAIPALCELTIHFAGCEGMDTLPPYAKHAPILAPRLRAVGFNINVDTRRCEDWISDVFPGFLRSHLVLGSPRLASITVDSRLQCSLRNSSIAALRTLTETLRVRLRRTTLEFEDTS